MSYKKKSSLLVSSLALLIATSIATAGEYEEGYAKGLHDLQDIMQGKVDNINSAIDENTANIGANTTAISNNAANIGTNANAINANTAAIQALQAGDTTYDYRDYAPTADIASKTYKIQNLGTCDTETRIFERNTTGDVTDVTMRRVRTEGGLPCRYHVFTFRATADGYYRTGTESYNKNGSVLNSTVLLDTPVLRRSSSMKVGQQFADATTTTLKDGAGNIIPVTGTYVEKSLLVGVEAVTVPYSAEPIEGCLKFHVFHEATSGFGTGLNNRIEWFCPSIGMVKRVQSNGAVYELTGIN